MLFDNVPETLVPSLYVPVVVNGLTCYLFNIHSKKDFIFSEIQKEMIQRFLLILKVFPERIIMSQVNGNEEVSYPFTNDENKDLTDEYVIRQPNHIDSFSESIYGVIDQIHLQKFLKEEREKALEDENYLNESRINLLKSCQPNSSENLNSESENQPCRFYQVKTKKIQWDDGNGIHSQNKNTKFFLHIFVDITHAEKLKNEVTLRKYQRLMISSVAHEFRNPLGAIQGNLDLIKMVSEDVKIQKFVKVAYNSCSLVNNYVEDILDLGRIERKAFQLNPVEFSLKDVTEEVAEIFELEFKNKRIRLIIDISQRLKAVRVK